MAAARPSGDESKSSNQQAPDFLLGLVGSTISMRLSLEKAALETLVGATYRKSGSVDRDEGRFQESDL
jgi:hypothetical protein